MRTSAFLALLAIATTTACAGPGPRERQEASLERHLAFAGEPVDSFHLRLMRQWQPLGDTHIVVYTALNEAWLLELEQPCHDPNFGLAISLTSSGSRVYRRFDSVRFKNDTCRIHEIRPVDVRAMKAANRAPAGEASTS